MADGSVISAQVDVPIVLTQQIKTDTTASTDLTIITGTTSTLVLDDCVYDDLQFGISGAKVPATKAPNWETFTANTSEYAFSTSDYIDCSANEPPHWWSEGTSGDAHLHFTIKTATTAAYYVKFNTFWAYASTTGGTWASVTTTGETAIASGTTSLTAYYQDMEDLTLTGYKVGSQVKVRVQRIPATSGTEYPDDVYITQVGLHLQKVRLGSRLETSA